VEAEEDDDVDAGVEAVVGAGVEAEVEAVEGAGVVTGFTSVGVLVVGGVEGVGATAGVALASGALSSFFVAGFLATALETITTKKSLDLILQDAKV